MERAPCEPARGQPRRGATPRDHARRRADRDGSARLDGADRRAPRRGGRDRAPDPRGVAAAPRRVRAHPRGGRRPRLSGDRRRPRGGTRAGLRRDRSARRLRRPRGTCPACRGSARGRTDDRPTGPLDRHSVHWTDPDRGRPAPGGDRCPPRGLDGGGRGGSRGRAARRAAHRGRRGAVDGIAARRDPGSAGRQADRHARRPTGDRRLSRARVRHPSRHRARGPAADRRRACRSHRSRPRRRSRRCAGPRRSWRGSSRSRRRGDDELGWAGSHD